MSESVASTELEGLSVRLDRLVHRIIDPQQYGGRRHQFIYFLSILNESEYTVTFIGRKWIVDQSDGDRLVIEGDGIVGETPCIPPGGVFSYNSFHLTNLAGHAEGSFHGLDEFGRKVHVRIPRFHMEPPAP
jgi:ApaG protein